MNWKRVSFIALATALAGGLACGTNHAPDVPVLPAGPEYCFKDTVYTFTTTVADPDGDSLAVRFDWGDSAASYWVGWFASGETVAFTHAWSDTGSFEVRVLAQDRQLVTSDSSAGLIVRVADRRPPETPAVPLGPDLGGVDTSYMFIAGADHPEGIPVAIRFAWGDGDTSGWSEFGPSGGPVDARHTWSAPGAYYVTAQAKDTGEVMSLWSSPHTIVIHQTARLKMVGSPTLTADSLGFLIRIINDGTVEVAVSSLMFSSTSESLYMRDFWIDRDHCGYPLPSGVPGTGPGDTVHFTAPVTIAPDGTQLVELFFHDFHVDPLGADFPANVHGRQFAFRFSDGSEITVNL